MKRRNIKNKRALAASGIAAFCMLGAIVSYILQRETRFLLAAGLLAIYALVKGADAFTKDNVLAQLASVMDERDTYLTLRSAHIVLQSVNYVLAAAIFVCLFLYAAWKWSHGLIIAFTLCGVEVYLFVSFLWISHRLEKKG